jgi:hypothetical protein
MRVDLLLLPDPLQQLAQLMPGQHLLEHSRWNMDRDMHSLAALTFHLQGHSSSSSSSSSGGGGGSSWPALPSGTLQLAAYLLLLAAARWQPMHHYILQDQGRSSAAVFGSDRASALRGLQERLTEHSTMLGNCVKLLHAAVAALRRTGQWEQQMQQLQQQQQQQQGGRVLLQGLTLALHCRNLDVQLQQQEGLGVQALLTALSSPLSQQCTLGEYRVRKKDLQPRHWRGNKPSVLPHSDSTDMQY